MPAPEPITGPLWALMLSTNACYPGCGCEKDRFDRSPLAVARWVAAMGPTDPARALEQLRELIDGVTGGRVERGALSRQTNVFFRHDEAAADWLRGWEAPLQHTLRTGPRAVERAEARAKLARNFARKGRH